MTDHFNGLTPAEAERLAMLAEECAEVIQIVAKIQRHGYESFHPNDPSTTNRMLLKKELIDLAAVEGQMLDWGDVRLTEQGEIGAAWKKKLRYSHHQKGSQP